jgi:hypothetical protein
MVYSPVNALKLPISKLPCLSSSSIHRKGDPQKTHPSFFVFSIFNKAKNVPKMTKSGPTEYQLLNAFSDGK